MKRALVTGAGGFIGGHLVTHLRKQGWWVRGVDLKMPRFRPSDADEFQMLDLRQLDACLRATRDVDHVYALAADMGGMGFISANHATILRNNALIDLHLFEAARVNGVDRYLYASSACVYPAHLQTATEVTALRESDAFPAAPQEAYGWEKLLGELICRFGGDEFGIDTRVVRFHNVYGPYGTFQGGREKAPSALCRKVAMAAPDGTIEVWGDGEQTRSFCYVDDCVDGLTRLMHSGFRDPLNIGSDHLVTINQLAEIAIRVSGKANIRIVHTDGPQGVRGRNSDNTKLREVLGWEPTTPLTEGMAATYNWIAGELGAGSRRLH